MRAPRLILAAVLAATTLSAAPALAATPAPAPSVAAPTVNAQGIIMRDGGICDPIRHMGC
jgi:hypothetical protein